MSLVLAVPLLALGTALVGALLLARRHPAAARRVAGVLGASLLVAVLLAWLWPLERHVFEGHEATYAAIADGLAPLASDEGPYLSTPLLRLLAWLWPGPARTLLWWPIAAGALWSAALAGLALPRRGSPAQDRLGLALGLLLAALLPGRVWAHTLLPVMAPAALWMAAAWLVIRGPAGWLGPVVAAALAGLAVSLRIDTWVWCPLLLGLAWAEGPRPRQQALRCAALAAPWLLATPLTQGGVAGQGGGDDVAYYLRMLAAQLGFLEPWGLWWGAAGVCALVALLAAGGRRALVWLPGAALGHLLLATFNDYGARHTLPARGLLAALALRSCLCLLRDTGAPEQRGMARLGRARRPLGGALLAGFLLLSGWASLDRARRYHAESWAPFDPVVAAGPEQDLEAALSEGCLLITDHEGLWARGVARSHANLVDPEEAARLWRDHDGCVLWLRDREDVRWTSRSVMDRAARLQHLWRWRPLGPAVLEDGTRVAVYRWF